MASSWRKGHQTRSCATPHTSELRASSPGSSRAGEISGYRLARRALARLAGVLEATLARSLLSKAIEDADPDASSTTAILDGIPGAYERAIQSLERAHAGKSIALDDL